MDLTERKLKILQAIIFDYVALAEPVGSRTLSKNYDLGISAATIRNEMSDLEEMGYLRHPHASAGRIPTDKAYRYYVNELMGQYELPNRTKAFIRDKLSENILEFDKTMEKAASLLSEMTNLISFAISPKQETNEIRYINIMPLDEYSVLLVIVCDGGKINNLRLNLNTKYTEESLRILSMSMTYHYKGKSITDALTLDIIRHFETDIESIGRLTEEIYPNFLSTLQSMLDVELYMDGLAHIFDIPEYNDMSKAKSFMEMLEKKKSFTEMLANRDDGVIITIGKENDQEVMEGSSLITATYRVDGSLVGKLGVIGPTRMRYSEITSVVEYMTKNINNTFRMLEGGENE